MDRSQFIEQYRQVRSATEKLAGPLTAEDQLLQSMPLCSPTKWHRAHTTWFFETFILAPQGVAPVNLHYSFLFNSYYEAVGPRHERPRRGMLSRPSHSEIAVYRRVIDARMHLWSEQLPESELVSWMPLLQLGLHHEQQHQELLLTDILHAFSLNPLRPVYKTAVFPSSPVRNDEALYFVDFEGGVFDVGATASADFSFDNEAPRHRVFLEPFALSSRLVTIRELKAFIDAGGYDTPNLWLSEGFDFIRCNGISAPLYARYEGGEVIVFGLHGERMANDDEPVVHVSYYEADAMARFLGARLPTEQEWEVAAMGYAPEGNFVESGALRALPAPASSPESRRMTQVYGDAWQWTRSSYAPYPGYVPAAGAVGEYNGKFMVNQYVLRGGSCYTPTSHMRKTYRNFWHPDTRFQVSGIRLARDRSN